MRKTTNAVLLLGIAASLSACAQPARQRIGGASSESMYSRDNTRPKWSEFQLIMEPPTKAPVPAPAPAPKPAAPLYFVVPAPVRPEKPS